MRKRLIVWFVVVAAIALPGQEHPRKFLMWKVTSPTATVYLVGSIHLADKSFFPLPAQVERAFAESKVLAVEADVSNVNMEEAMGLMGQYGMYGEGDSLGKHLDPDTSRALDAYCSKNGLPRELMERMKPWIVAILVEATAAQKAGMDSESGIDMHFLHEVNGQRVDQLESVTFQFKLLGSQSEREQEEFLADALKSPEDIGKMEHVYEAGDANAITKEMAKEETRSYYRRLIDDRNPAMTDKVDAYLQGHETAFVVVGMAHVVGESGIAKSLERRHYKVEQGTYEW